MSKEKLQEKMYGAIADLPLTWLNTAQDLKRSADLLTAAVNASGELSDKRAARGHFASYHLLMSFAFENLVKGVSILHSDPDPDRFENARKYWKHDGGHGTLAIAEQVVSLSATERSLLRKLQEFAVWAGRYSIPNKSGRFDTDHWVKGDLFLDNSELDAVQPLFSRLENEILSVVPSRSA